MIPLEEVERADFRHPTRKGTTEILRQISAKIPIVLDDCSEDDTTLPLKYRGVQTIFKVGCRGCDSLAFTRSLCATCVAAAHSLDIQGIEERIRILKEQTYPAIDVNMADPNKKRAYQGDENEPDDPNAKSVRTGSD